MYADLDSHNDAARLAMGRLDRQVAQVWRYRHHRSAASRMLSAAWAGIQGIVSKAAHVAKPGIAPARQRLSY